MRKRGALIIKIYLLNSKDETEIKMEKANKTVRLYFFFALGLSIGFPLGVLGIIFGAINDIIPLLVFGIILAVLGFYAMPILWIKYAEHRSDRTLLSIIENEYIYTVSALADHTGYNEETVRTKIKRLIFKRALIGYIFNGDELVLNTNENPAEKTMPTRKCESCGATMIYDGNKYKCEYCLSVFDAE